MSLYSSTSSSTTSSVGQRILLRLSTSAEEAIPYERLKEELQLGASDGHVAVRQLMEQNRVQLRRGTGSDTQIYISLVNNINENLSMVLDAVRASGSSGIDQAQLLAKVRMPKTEVGKSLAALTAKNLIKEHRSVTNRAKRIYTLFHIDPSSRVTGGTLYCGEEIDITFVDEWRRELTRFVSTRRSVSFDQITHHVGVLQGVGGDGARESAASSTEVKSEMLRSSSNVGAPLANGEVAVAMIDSLGHARLGGTPALRKQPLTNTFAAASKQLSETDLATLVQSLVLDGVLEMVVSATSAGSSGPHYQIAHGQNVMRHFTAQARVPQQRSTTTSVKTESPPQQRFGCEEELVQRLSRYSPLASALHPSATGEEGAVAAIGSLPDMESVLPVGNATSILRPASLWEPAPVSLPSAQAALNGWSYTPALGSPCLGCPLLMQCTVSGRGVVNPTSCAYLKDWLS